MNLSVGCSGWSYSGWVGPFYPKDAWPGEFLQLYAKLFDCVEIDSTFYRMPSRVTVKRWCNVTPSNFIFTPKLPRRITHDQRLKNVTGELSEFVNTISLLDWKLGPILIQLPPSFRYHEHQPTLLEFIASLDSRYRYAVEFRDESWFVPEIQKLLEDRNICQVWSVNQYLTTPATITADFVYVRFIGDRSIREFGRLQKDQTKVMKPWVKTLQETGNSVQNAFVFFNNHFAGFGPGSVNEFRRLIGLDQLDWSTLTRHDRAQVTLFDFKPE
jgi:uncharacterized protein YecE (DUF72 family)